MKKTAGRILSIILVLSLTVSMLPSTVFAMDSVAVNENGRETTDASVSDEPSSDGSDMDWESVEDLLSEIVVETDTDDPDSTDHSDNTAESDLIDETKTETEIEETDPENEGGEIDPEAEGEETDPENRSIESFEIIAVKTGLTVGEELQLIALVMPESADISGVLWESTDETVLTVDNSGLVTAVGIGEAAVQAEYEGFYAAKAFCITEEPTAALGLSKMNAVDSGTCTDGLEWILDEDGTLTISGSGPMGNYGTVNNNGVTVTNAPWGSYYTQIKSLVIEDGVTGVGNYAFYSCTELTDITFSEELEAVGEYAFYSCSKISGTLEIPDSVTGIGRGAFQNCSGISGLKLSEKLTVINSYTFYNCSGITGELKIPDSVTAVYYQAFAGCSKVESIVVGGGLKTLGNASSYYDGPFYGMGSVKEVTFRGETVPTINPADVFYSMNSLERVYVPLSSLELYENALGRYLNNAGFSTDALTCTVKGLEASMIFSSSVRFIWHRHPDDSIKEYVISRDGEEIGRTENLFFNDYDLETGKQYTYAVSGINSEGGITKESVIKVTPAEIKFSGITTNHRGNKIAVTDGKIYITAANNKNGIDYDGQKLTGKLYYLNELNRRVLIGTSSVSIAKNISHCVNWDVSGMDEGEYKLVFVYTDPDGKTTEATGKVEVDNSVPAKIINVIAVGDLTNIGISWSQSSEVDSTVYKIYRKSETDPDFTLLKTINGRTTLSYTDSSVKEDTVYTYYVVTVNSFGFESEPSETASAKKALDTEAPIITKISPQDYSYISGKQTVTVTAKDNLQVTGSKLYYSRDGKPWTLIGSANGSTVSFTFDTTVIEDGTVQVKAIAYDSAGNSSDEKKVNYSIDNAGPEAVTGLTASVVFPSKLTLKWNDVAAEDAAGFILERKQSDGSFVIIASDIKTLGYNLEGLVPDTEYVFRVAAKDVRGNKGEYSDEYTVKTISDDTAPVVTSLLPTASRRNDTINFVASAGDDHGVESIEIQVSRDLVNWSTVSTGSFAVARKEVTYTFPVSVATYDDGSLFVRAVAADFSGNVSDTGDSAAFVEYLVDKTAPSSPRDFLACGGDGYIYLSWLQGDEEDLGKYSVYRSTSEDSGFIMLASGIDKVNYYDTSAERDTVYYYKLAVRDTVGNISEFSQTVSATVAEDISAPEVVSINPGSGSLIGPEYHTVEALVRDNNCIESVSFEYKVNDEEEYALLKEISNIGYYYKTVRAEIPLEGLQDGDSVSGRIKCTDVCGYESEYSAEYLYCVDSTAPELKELQCTLEGDSVTLEWKDAGDADLAGFKIYRVNGDGAETFIGSRSMSSGHSYSFIDNLGSVGDGDYVYRILAFDTVGNSRDFLSDVVNYEAVMVQKENQAPTAVICGMSNMEIGVEEVFDASASDDDGSIVSYHWDFGDGRESDEISPVKKYKSVGSYTVCLTVEDECGLTGTDYFDVEVMERTAVGTVKVNVVDENDKPVTHVPVYFDLGGKNQTAVYTDSKGCAQYNLGTGEYAVGCYSPGYLPATKKVTVLPNTAREVTLTVIKEEIVTGKFQVTRMTFQEIKDAKIDVYDPANQNLYKVKVTLRYGKTEIPIEYIRNDTKIVKYIVENVGGNGVTISAAGSGEPQQIIGVSYVPNKENKEIIAILMMNMTAGVLKEFFDVKLHIVNNAASSFCLKDNTLKLSVPEGLTVMKNIACDGNTDTQMAYKDNADGSSAVNVTFGNLYGQQTKTISWILRGDEVGEYNLEAAYGATLDVFNVPVTATFKTEEPIRVYGMTDFLLDVEVNNEIRYNALYFNIGLVNKGSVDFYNPTLDFDGIVTNITCATIHTKNGLIQNIKEDPAYSHKSVLLNVKHISADGTEEYISYTKNSNGTINTGIDTLSPGERIYYEYAAYNVIDYDGIGYFYESVAEVLEGMAGEVNVHEVSMDLYSMDDPEEILKRLLDSDSEQAAALEYLFDEDNYISSLFGEDSGTAGEALYELLCVALELDMDKLTGEEKKEMADDILLELITSETTTKIAEEIVDLTYLEGARSFLELGESSFKNIDPGKLKKEELKTRDKVLEAISDIKKDPELMKKLAKGMEKAGGEYAEESPECYYELFGAILGITDAAGVYFINKYLKKNNTFFEVSKFLAKSANHLGNCYDLIAPVLEAQKDVSHMKYIHSVIHMEANKQAALIVLNSVIAEYGYSGSKAYNLFVKKAKGEEVYNKRWKLHDNGLGNIILQEAKELKEMLLKDTLNLEHEFSMQYMKEIAVATVDKHGEDVVKLALTKAAEAAGVAASTAATAVWVYKLAGVAFSLADIAFKWEEKYKQADKFAIYTYLAYAFESSYRIFAFASADATAARMVSDGPLLDQLTEEGKTVSSEEMAAYALLSLKNLVFTRLQGEAAFKAYISGDNTTLLKSDKNFDANIVKYLSEKFGQKFDSIEDIYDMVYGNLLSKRDIIFNIQEATTLEKPAAPEVTIDYDRMTTVQNFDRSYEYCYSDGVWHSCVGGPVSISPKTYVTVLRIRKKSSDSTMAGEITTVNIYAKKELSKVITAQYTDGAYTFSNLNANYSYEVTAVTSMTAKPDWTKAVEIKGSSAAVARNVPRSGYIAIRAKQNDKLRELATAARIIAVSDKYMLNVRVEGNGYVTQSGSGMYYAGDDVTLTACQAGDDLFVGWFVDGICVGTNEKYILEMQKYSEITAMFAGAAKAKSIFFIDEQMPVMKAAYEELSEGEEQEIEEQEIEEQEIEEQEIEEQDTEQQDTEQEPVRQKAGAAVEMSITLFAGAEKKLYLDTEPGNAKLDDVVWSSSDDAVATVDSGLITAVSEGSAVITASVSEMSIACAVTVEANSVTELNIVREPSILTYYEGAEFDSDGLSVCAVYEDGNEKYIEDYEISGFESDTVGEKTVTVSKDDASDSFTVEIVHDGVWTVTKEADCREEGEISLICRYCEEVLDTKPVACKEHSYYSTVIDDGEETYHADVCGVCGDVQKKDGITPHTHSFEEKHTDPDCEHNGKTEYTCTVCGYSYTVRPEYDEENESWSNEELLATGHSYEKTVVAPACSCGGYTLEVCSECGHRKLSEAVPKLEHELHSRTVPASCGAQGYDETYCENCDYSVKTNYTDALRHSYEVHEIEADCEHGAGAEYVCVNCGNTYYVDDGEKLEHDYKTETVPATCEEGGCCIHTCTICGGSYRDGETEAAGHAFGEWLVRRASTKDARGVLYRVCVNCGKEELSYTAKADHVHTPGEWETEEPGCGTYGVRKRCCTECGEIMESEEIEPLEHSYKETVVAPTCTEKGYTGHVCEHCGDSYKTEETEAKGHVSGEWTVVREPGCTSYGFREKRCTVCGERTDYERINAKGHTPVTDSSVTGDCTEDGLSEGQHCSVCGRILVRQVKVSSSAHDWGEAVYEWNEDLTHCTATRVCRNDPDHIETSTGAVTVRIKTKASYGKPGVEQITAVFDRDWAETQTAERAYTVEYSGSGSSGGGGSALSISRTTATFSKFWYVDSQGIWRVSNNGMPVRSVWLCDDAVESNGKNVWYLIKADGTMMAAGLVQDSTGNFYSLETNHNGYFGMLRYQDGTYDCDGTKIYIEFSRTHDGTFGAIRNREAIEALKAKYGVTKCEIGNEFCVYTSTFR